MAPGSFIGQPIYGEIFGTYSPVRNHEARRIENAQVSSRAGLIAILLGRRGNPTKLGLYGI
jgi:hypothetical protein